VTCYEAHQRLLLAVGKTGHRKLCLPLVVTISGLVKPILEGFATVGRLLLFWQGRGSSTGTKLEPK
jgi:hypothetical protein